MSQTDRGTMRRAYAVMLVGPMLFASNIVFGRGLAEEVAPFTLAFLRWGLVAVALSPVVWIERAAVRRLLRASGGRMLLLAFLGMWVCGGGVYFALSLTTATNGTLIYTTSPVIILVLEALFLGRRIGLREAAGAIVAFAGICVILMRGDLSAMTRLDFGAGDLVFVGAAFAWAGYSILYRGPAQQGVGTFAMLGVLAGLGALQLLPFVALEWLAGQPMPRTAQAWSGIAGLVVFASLGAFSAFQFGIRHLGAAIAGIFMYLMPAYGVSQAMLFLGETLHAHHLAGIILVIGGVALATAPLGRAAAPQPSRPSAGKVSSSQ